MKNFGEHRYGGTYKLTCKRAHESTGGRCTNCFRKTTKLTDGWNDLNGELHHLHYWSFIRLLLDLWRSLRGQPYPGTYGEVKGREWIGWDALPLCYGCHQGPGGAHSRRHWKQSRFKPELFNRSRFGYAWQLRLKWLLLKILTPHL